MPSPSSPRRGPLYSVGDPVLYTYIKGTRKVVVPVVISKVGLWVGGDPSGGVLVSMEVIAYKVSSGRGGELRVLPSELRPDTILDRITVALDDAE